MGIFSSIILLTLRASFAAPIPTTGASELAREDVARAMEMSLRRNELPRNLEMSVRGTPRSFHVNYALDGDLQRLMDKQVKSYRPDYAAFVALEAETGRILSLVSYSTRKSSENLALKGSFPAASIFKIVTATAAMDLGKARPYTVIPFNGGLHTLYRRNVTSNNENRWTRRLTLSEAFAKSVNTVFAKLGVYLVGGEALKLYADRFYFNHTIPADIPAESGKFDLDETNHWKIAEAASGFNRDITLSPVHGVLMASAVINGGVAMEPYLIDSLSGEDGIWYESHPRQLSAFMAADTAASMRSLMQDTVRRGTSAKVFRGFLNSRRYSGIEVGGKTGSLTGNVPKGKYDWFVGFAANPQHKIAIAALTINEDLWKVKSSQLARTFVEGYFRKVQDTASRRR